MGVWTQVLSNRPMHWGLGPQLDDQILTALTCLGDDSFDGSIT